MRKVVSEKYGCVYTLINGVLHYIPLKPNGKPCYITGWVEVTEAPPEILDILAELRQ